MSTVAQIITKFELQVSDVTELSTAEEITILDRVHKKVCNLKPWEFMKKPATGSILSDSVGSYCAVPSDFAYFAMNDESTDNSVGIENNASPKVIFVIDSSGNYIPWQIVNYSDRRQYKNRSGFAYLDMVSNKIYFTYPPVGTTYEFDYIKFPATLVSSDSPLFPTSFEDVLVYGMAIENDILQLSPAATLAHVENAARFQSYIDDLSYWNANLQMN